VRIRATTYRSLHPVARGAIHARLAIRKGQPRYAVNPLSNVLKHAPDWKLGWTMAASVFTSIGYTTEAENCRRQAG
jgi:Tfp pilus assembly protein PilF